jgi:hypothetical protein
MHNLSSIAKDTAPRVGADRQAPPARHARWLLSDFDVEAIIARRGPHAIEFRGHHRLDSATHDAVPGARRLRHGGEGQRHHELHELVATSAGAAAP